MVDRRRRWVSFRALDSVTDRLRPLAYFAGFAAGNWLGLLRGLRDTRVAVPTRARLMLSWGVWLAVALLALLGPLLVLAGAAGGMLVARAAYDGAGWTVTVSLAGLVALTVVELAGHAASEAGMRIARPAAWLVAVAGLIVATAGLAGVIG